MTAGRSAASVNVQAAAAVPDRQSHAAHLPASRWSASRSRPALPVPETCRPSLFWELDDGLLTASEVAQLELNADWVVLSACNTAAGEKPGAEALSGLAAPSSIRAPARC